MLKAATLEGWIAANPTAEFSIIVAAGLLVFVQSLRGAARLGRLPRQDQRQRQLEKAVLASLKSVSHVTHVDLTTIGGCVYAVRGHAWPFRRRRLGRYRLNEYPQGSGIMWTDRKGVVGQSLRDVAPRHFIWRRPVPDHGPWTNDGAPAREPRTRMSRSGCPRSRRRFFPGFPLAGFAGPGLSCIVWGESPTIL